MKRTIDPAAAAFTIALVLRLIHVWQLRRSPFFDMLMGDARAYDEWARRIAGGEWIGREVFYQAPLYPYFLGIIYAAIGHSLLAVRVVQAIVGSASCALLALAGRRFFSDRAGLAAGIGLAIYAPAIFFDALLQKSVLDIFFIALALWLIARTIDDRPGQRRAVWLSLGGAMGGLSLTRENALVFIAVIVGWGFLVVRRKGARLKHVRLKDVRLKADTTSARGHGKKQPPASSGIVVSAFRRTLLPFTLGLGIVLLPVAIRNYAVGGGFYLTTSQFGPNFYIGNNPRSDGTYMSLRFGRGAPEYERQDATELAEHALNRHLTPGDVSAYWTDRALNFITTDPGAWLKLLGRKFLLLWNATEMLDTESQESYAEWSWPLRLGGWFGHFGVLVPLAVLGCIMAWPLRPRVGILYAMTGIYAASVLMFYVFARYRLPLVPLLMLFATYAVVTIADHINRRARKARRESNESGFFSAFSASSAVQIVVALVATAVMANWPILSKQRMRAITENNLATALQDAGRTDEAIAHYRRAIAIQPDYAPAYNNLGVVLRANGSVDAAIDSYQQALAVRGDYPDAHYNLANALLDKNKPAEAAEHFKIALQSIPDSAGASNNLGIALAAEGRHEDAINAFRAAVAAEPSSAKAHRNLGDSLTAAGRIDEGVGELRKAIALDPNDPDAHYNLGSVLLENDRLDDAISEFQATLKLEPQSAEAHNNLGIALGSQGKLDAAIEQFEQALRIDPTFADSQRNLAIALQAREQLRGIRR